MPTHELVSKSGDISLGRVLRSKYKKVNSIRNQWSELPFFLWVDAYLPSSGFHANLSNGWLFESKGNLFQARMKSLLGGSMKGVHQEIATHCELNGKIPTDRNCVKQMCPYILENGNMPRRIFEKVEKRKGKKKDEQFIVKALIEFFSLDDHARKGLIEGLKNTRIASQNPHKLLKKLGQLRSLPRLSGFLTRVQLKLDKEERNTQFELFLSPPSKWKDLLKMCGNHTTTVTCVNPSKDFCEGNSVTKHFGLTVLFALCLPGLVQGLSNVVFHKVDLLQQH